MPARGLHDSDRGTAGMDTKSNSKHDREGYWWACSTVTAADSSATSFAKQLLRPYWHRRAFSFVLSYESSEVTGDLDFSAHATWCESRSNTDRRRDVKDTNCVNRCLTLFMYRKLLRHALRYAGCSCCGRTIFRNLLWPIITYQMRWSLPLMAVESM